MESALKRVGTLITILLLTACGGGGGGETPKQVIKQEAVWVKGDTEWFLRECDTCDTLVYIETPEEYEPLTEINYQYNNGSVFGIGIYNDRFYEASTTVRHSIQLDSNREVLWQVSTTHDSLYVILQDGYLLVNCQYGKNVICNYNGTEYRAESAGNVPVPDSLVSSAGEMPKNFLKNEHPLQVLNHFKELLEF